MNCFPLCSLFLSFFPYPLFFFFFHGEAPCIFSFSHFATGSPSFLQLALCPFPESSRKSKDQEKEALPHEAGIGLLFFSFFSVTPLPFFFLRLSLFFLFLFLLPWRSPQYLFLPLAVLSLVLHLFFNLLYVLSQNLRGNQGIRKKRLCPKKPILVCPCFSPFLF